jgi:hypothetical protein
MNQEFKSYIETAIKLIELSIQNIEDDDPNLKELYNLAFSVSTKMLTTYLKTGEAFLLEQVEKMQRLLRQIEEKMHAPSM